MRRLLPPFAAILFFLSACAPVTAAPAVTAAQSPAAVEASSTPETFEAAPIMVGITNLITHAPLYFAQELGYFEEQDLNVELVSFGSQGGSAILTAVIQSQLDVAATAIRAATFNAIGEGSGIAIVAEKGYYDPAASCSDAALLARPELVQSGALQDPDVVRGLAFEGSVGTNSDLVIRRTLARLGLTRDSLEEEPVGLDSPTILEAFKNGSLDAATLSEPWLTRARSSAAAEVWAYYGDVIPNYPSGALVFSPAMLDRDPEVGIRFMTAYLKAIRAIREGATEENSRLMAEFTELDLSEVQSMCWPQFQADGTIDTHALAEFQDWMLEVGLLNAALPIEDIWDGRFVQAAAARLEK